MSPKNVVRIGLVVWVLASAFLGSWLEHRPAPISTGQVVTTIATTAPRKPVEPRKVVPKAPVAPKAPVVAPKAPVAHPVQVRKVGVEAKVRKLWPGNDEEVVRVIECETGGTWNPRARGSSDDRGLLQIVPRYHMGRLARLGYTPDDLFEVVPNIRTGWLIYLESGWAPWTCRP